MESLRKHIKECRPKLSEASIKTYSGILKTLSNALWKGHEIDYKKFTTHQADIFKYLEPIRPSIRKTTLSSLVVITEGTVQSAYRKQMIADAIKYNAEQKTHTMTEVQKANWLPWADIEERLINLKDKYSHVFKDKNATIHDKLNLQKYVLLSCYTMIPPRRALDFCAMRCKNFDKTKCNYYEKGKFIFTQYKTAKFSGIQIEKLPKALDILIKKWIAFSGSDYLFFDCNEKPVIQTFITKVLNSIFAPKLISVNMLRHIYITEKQGPLIAELKRTADAMGHSVEQQGLYVKD